MTRLLNRVARLVVGSTVLEAGGPAGLRMTFAITRTSTKEASSGRITVYNLAPSTRAALEEVQGRIALEAGYRDPGASGGGSVGALLVATKGEVHHEWDGVDWATTIEAQDGRAEFSQAVHATYGPGATALDVVRGLVALASAATGVSVASRISPAAQTALAATVFGRGVAFTPDEALSGALTIVANRAGVRLSFQDGGVAVLAADEEYPGRAILLEPASGLVGSPVSAIERTKVGDKTIVRSLLRGRSLLRADIVPHARIVVRSKVESADLRIERVDHVGDTHGAGDGWVTRWEGVRL